MVLAALVGFWGMVGMVVVVVSCIVADKAANASTMVAAIIDSISDNLAVLVGRGVGRGVPVALVHSADMVCSMLVSVGMVVVLGKGARVVVLGIGSGAGMAALAPALGTFCSGVGTVGREVLEARVARVVRAVRAVVSVVVRRLGLPGTMGRVSCASRASTNR